MVGDWPDRDVVGAMQLGMRTAFARYGDTFGTLHSGADYDLRDLQQLVEIVEQMEGDG
jgi:putative hydrolase of the HAD superfamily